MLDSKVIIASEFFNELDLLELKLGILYPVVDYFVISESTKTHSGLDKPLYYEENRERFKKYEDKIFHQVVETPSNLEELMDKYRFSSDDGVVEDIICKNIIRQDWFDGRVESYFRDNFEKEVLLLPVSRLVATTRDIILLGDLDEIPNPDTILYLKDNFNRDKVYHLEQGMYYYYLNCLKSNEYWRGTLATSINNFIANGFSRMRTYKEGVTLKNGGWHFTYMGEANRVKEKIKSWGEQSLNTPMVQDHVAYNLKNFLKEKRDVFFRPANFIIKDIHDGTFPEYLVENEEKYSKYIYKGEE